MRRFSALALLFAAVASCSDSTGSGTIEFITVDDPFGGPPAATTVNVDAIDSTTGAVTHLVTGASISNTSIDLGTLDSSATVLLRAEAFDAANDEVAWGETIPTAVDGIVGTVVPLFMQRTNALSTLPGTMTTVVSAPLLTSFADEYIFIAPSNSTAATPTQFYDLGPWGLLPSAPTLPIAAQSVAISELQVLSIDATSAAWLDLTTGDVTTATLPTGGAQWADVAGGQTVYATDGTAYVIGGTRSTPSSAVLVISTTQGLSFATLTTARAGAAAGWVDGVGLVIAGGSATAAGIEVLAESATAGAALPYPADPSTGGGLDALDSTHAVVVTGTSARLINLTCSSACTPVDWTALPEALVEAQVFAIDAASAFIVGNDAAGLTHAVRASASTATEVPFRVGRNNARAVRLPMGNVAVVGGDATIEAFAP